MDETILEEVRALARLDLKGLREAWRQRYGTPPRLRSADLLARMRRRLRCRVLSGAINRATAPKIR